MTQVYAEDGRAIPVTVIQAGPCVVVQRKTKEKDGYEAVQLGPRRGPQGQAGHQGHEGPLREGRPAALPRAARVPASRTATRPRSATRSRWSIFAPGDTHQRRRDQQGQGLPGRRQAPPLPRRRGHPRLDVPPRARLDRRLGLPVARPQGHARGRPHGLGPRHRAEPKVVRVDAENNILVVKGVGPRRRRRLRGHPEGVGTWPRSKKARRRRRRRQGRRPQEGRPKAAPVAEGADAAEAGAAARPSATSVGEDGAVDGRERREREGQRRRACTPRCSASRVNEHLLYEAVKQYRAGARARHARHQEPRAGLRLGQEALAAEGHRPRPRRRDRAPRSGGTAAPCSGPSPATTPTRMPKKARAARCARRSASA